ncbi:hypothetical protein ACFSQ7_25755 [Paenibacillus rhizoplanae]
MKEISGEVPEWIVIPPMTGPYGDQIVERKIVPGQFMGYLQKKRIRRKIIRILSMLNYFFTDQEAYPNFAYGIKGIHWDVVDGKIKKIKTSELSKDMKEKVPMGRSL